MQSYYTIDATSEGNQDIEINTSLQRFMRDKHFKLFHLYWFSLGQLKLDPTRRPSGIVGLKMLIDPAEISVNERIDGLVQDYRNPSALSLKLVIAVLHWAIDMHMGLCYDIAWNTLR